MPAAPLGRHRNRTRWMPWCGSPQLPLAQGSSGTPCSVLGTAGSRQTRAHGEQTPPVLGTEEALVEPMLLARDTMLLFRAFSMKSAAGDGSQ